MRPLPVLTLAVALASCGGVPLTPRSAITAPLEGRWFTGSLSTIRYYDPSTGVFQDPSGSGYYFVFGPQGDYETGAVIDSLVAGCQMRLLGVEVGTVTQAGTQLTLYRDHITTHATNSCGSSGDRTQGQAVQAATWAVAPDEHGLEWLTLTFDDGSQQTYRRWTQ